MSDQQRLNDLEARVAQLSQQLTDVRSGSQDPTGFNGPRSRRQMFKMAGAAALGAGVSLAAVDSAGATVTEQDVGVIHFYDSAPTNYTIPYAGAYALYVIGAGGGGGGGGSSSGIPNQVGGAGGGAGSFIFHIGGFNVGDVLTIANGAGGAGGTPGASGGGAGGNGHPGGQTKLSINGTVATIADGGTAGNGSQGNSTAMPGFPPGGGSSIGSGGVITPGGGGPSGVPLFGQLVGWGGGSGLGDMFAGGGGGGTATATNGGGGGLAGTKGEAAGFATNGASTTAKGNNGMGATIGSTGYGGAGGGGGAPGGAGGTGGTGAPGLVVIYFVSAVGIVVM